MTHLQFLLRWRLSRPWTLIVFRVFESQAMPEMAIGLFPDAPLASMKNIRGQQKQILNVNLHVAEFPKMMPFLCFMPFDVECRKCEGSHPSFSYLSAFQPRWALPMC